MIKSHRLLKIEMSLLVLSSCLFFKFCGFTELSEKDVKSRLMKKHLIGKDWKKLELLNVFPTKEDEMKTHYFQYPVDLEMINNKFIFVTDTYLHQILKFDGNGKYVGTIGKRGEGPGEFSFPNKIRSSKDESLFILEGGKPNIQIIDKDGNYIRSFKVFHHMNDFILRNNFIYSNCFYPDEEENPLIVRFDVYGKMIDSFGKRIDKKGHLSRDSSIFLSQSENEIIAVFEHYPLVRRYTSEGILLKEFRINIDIFNELEKYNYKKEYTNPTPNVINLPRLTAGVKAIDNRIFILAHLPRLEIIEMDIDGNIKDYYYSTELKNVVNLSGFGVEIIKEDKLGDKLLFAVLQSYEEAQLYVFQIKNK